jgi:hypothetical protein
MALATARGVAQPVVRPQRAAERDRGGVMDDTQGPGEDAAHDALAALLDAETEATDAEGALPLPAGMDRDQVRAAVRVALRVLRERRRQRAHRANLPANVGRPWTAEQDAALLAGFDAGSTPEALAAQLQRLPTGIRARLERHGRLVRAPAPTA